MSATMAEMAIYPPKLRRAAHLRVIAPSRSMSIIDSGVRAVADRRLADLGFVLSFGSHVELSDEFSSSSVEDRLADLHEAFADPHVDGILTAIGGFNTNQLLDGVDYELVQTHPKVFCGFSDITALANALLARAGLVTYSGPHYSSFGMKRHFEYTEEGFQSCLLSDAPIEVQPSAMWSDDMWFVDQDDRRLEANSGWWILNEGEAEGTIVGGNLCTFNLLQGTRFMPSLNGTVVFIEDDSDVRPWDFDRDLVSLIDQSGFGGVRGLVIGRFQRASEVTRELLTQIIATKPQLVGMPVVANVDFGHTTPTFTFPIGGTVTVHLRPPEAHLMITRH